MVTSVSFFFFVGTRDSWAIDGQLCVPEAEVKSFAGGPTASHSRPCRGGDTARGHVLSL